jgi:hypothetical protein
MSKLKRLRSLPFEQQPKQQHEQEGVQLDRWTATINDVADVLLAEIISYLSLTVHEIAKWYRFGRRWQSVLSNARLTLSLVSYESLRSTNPFSARRRLNNDSSGQLRKIRPKSWKDFPETVLAMQRIINRLNGVTHLRIDTIQDYSEVSPLIETLLPATTIGSSSSSSIASNNKNNDESLTKIYDVLDCVRNWNHLHTLSAPYSHGESIHGLISKLPQLRHVYLRDSNPDIDQVEAAMGYHRAFAGMQQARVSRSNGSSSEEGGESSVNTSETSEIKEAKMNGVKEDGRFINGLPMGLCSQCGFYRLIRPCDANESFRNNNSHSASNTNNNNNSSGVVNKCRYATMCRHCAPKITVCRVSCLCTKYFHHADYPSVDSCTPIGPCTTCIDQAVQKASSLTNNVSPFFESSTNPFAPKKIASTTTVPAFVRNRHPATNTSLQMITTPIATDVSPFIDTSISRAVSSSSSTSQHGHVRCDGPKCNALLCRDHIYECDHCNSTLRRLDHQAQMNDGNNGGLIHYQRYNRRRYYCVNCVVPKSAARAICLLCSNLIESIDV